MTEKLKYSINIIILIVSIICVHLFIPEWLTCFSYIGFYGGIILSSIMVGCGLHFDDNGVSPMLILAGIVLLSSIDCGVFFGLLVIGVTIVAYEILEEKF